MTRNPFRITVLASGRGSNLEAILRHIEAGHLTGTDVGLVISDRRDAGALRIARRHGVHAEHVGPVPADRGGKDEHERRIIETIEAHDAEDLIVLAGYMRILGERILDTYEGRIVNTHPSLLPAFRGMDGPALTLEGGARITGCTTHFVDQGVDTGPIILQAAVRVHPDDDRDLLHQRIQSVEHLLLPRTIDLFRRGAVRRQGRRVHVDGAGSWAHVEGTRPPRDALMPLQY